MSDDNATLVDFFDQPNEPEDPLRKDLIAMIRQRDHATPRHLQVELGPSEVAHPCMRKMALGMMDAPRCNPQFDPLPSIIGVATHKWLESAASYDNAVLAEQGKAPRWLYEKRVNVAPGLAGSCDLYDLYTDTVIDWKVPGANRFAKYRKDPGPVYKMQVHLYGRGFENAGLSPKRVAIALLPRGGTLRGLKVWQADYDQAIADTGLRRRDAVIAMLNDFQIEQHPEHYEWIPITPYDCAYCPWFRPEPTSPVECRGDQ